MANYYAGIGSRETPVNILGLMEVVARKLAIRGFILRSGGALGADSAFEKGANRISEIFLPWVGYNGKHSIWHDPDQGDIMAIAERHHPNWAACSKAARLLHARNVQIMLGDEGKRSVDMVICWTPGGRTIGGTGQAIRMANHYGIPVFNLYHSGALQRIAEFLKK